MSGSGFECTVPKPVQVDELKHHRGSIEKTVESGALKARQGMQGESEVELLK